MEPFEVYKLYMALKLHFTTDTYDITEYKGAVRAKKETFLKRKDLTSIRKLARDYKRKEIIDLLVANFVTGDKWGGLFDQSCVDNYKKFLTRRKQMLYNLNADLDLILFRMEKDGIESALKDEGHPLIFRMYMAGDIKIESLVIIEKLFPFIDAYADDFVLESICRLINKYKPFVRFDKDDVKQRYSGKIQQCLNQ
jgi:hypothetical protein